MSAIAGGAAIGAGVGVSSVALAPFNAANTFMGSAFFGYGMILGERYMYQSDWPKIQQRLENGEKIENIIQEYTGTFTAVVMKEAKIIFDTVTREFISIMSESLRGVIPQPVTQPTEGPTIGDPRRPPSPSVPVPPPVIPQPPSVVIGGVTLPPVAAPQPPEPKNIRLQDGSYTTFTKAVNRFIAIGTFILWRTRTSSIASVEPWRISEQNWITRNQPKVAVAAFPFFDYNWKLGEPYPIYKP